MKRLFPAFLVLLFSVTTTPAQTQVQCRPLQKNDFIGPDETIVGSGDNVMVCHTVVVAKVQPTKPAAPEPIDSAPAPAARVFGGTPLSKKVPRLQAAFGYQYDSVNLSGYGTSTSRTNTNGAFAQVIGNLSSNVSVIGNVDAIYKNIPVTRIDGSGNTVQVPGRDYLLTYAGGVQAYPMGHRKWMPFARSTFGAAHIRIAVPYQTNCGLVTCVLVTTATATGFAWQIGGGLDYRLHPESRIAIRLGQFDYGQMKKNGVNVNSIKLGGGLTF